MPSSRQPHDPFTDTALRPTTSNHTLRNQTSQHSLQSNASAASSHTGTSRVVESGGYGRNHLFAPSLSRRPTSRATPRAGGDEVLADSDSEMEQATTSSAAVTRSLRPSQQHSQQQRRHSPDMKSQRAVRGAAGGGGKGLQKEEPEFVNRQPDGSYLLGVAGFGNTLAVPVITMPRTEEEADQAEMDAHYLSISRQYFTSGAASGGKGGKKHEEELEALRLPMMMRLREQVMEKLEGERWQYEAVEWPPPGMF